MSNKIKVFDFDDRPSNIRKGSKQRDWMDQTWNRYAYRCLPLSIANQHGYEVFLDEEVKIIWDGGEGVDSIIIKQDKKNVQSHFGFGIITFHVNCLIRTPRDVNLYISGPPNNAKRHISPLTGIVETDWNPATFTMNWQITEPHVQITFEKGESFCFFFPIQRGYIESFDVEKQKLSENDQECEKYSQWAASRDYNINDITADWQKHYFKGKYNDGTKCPVNHQTKIKLNDIK